MDANHAFPPHVLHQLNYEATSKSVRTFHSRVIVRITLDTNCEPWGTARYQPQRSRTIKERIIANVRVYWVGNNKSRYGAKTVSSNKSWEGETVIGWLFRSSFSSGVRLFGPILKQKGESDSSVPIGQLLWCSLSFVAAAHPNYVGTWRPINWICCHFNPRAAVPSQLAVLVNRPSQGPKYRLISVKFLTSLNFDDMWKLKIEI